jgi:antitoxin (DNA-binding transcriptional repressor) of toxin-antitoxin stability system
VRELVDGLGPGEEIVIDSGDKPVAVLRAPDRPRGRTVEEVIAGLRQRERELGHPLRMGADFADDMEEIIASRKPRDTGKWD